MKIRVSLLTVACLIAFLVAARQPAVAYADPGSGALIWQVGSSMLVVALFYCRRFLGRIAHVFRRTQSRDAE